MTIRQQGGIFGRNPTFNDVTANELTVSGATDFSGGNVLLNGNLVGGLQVTIADDAVAVITPPRTGGYCMISAFTGTTPQLQWSGFFTFDSEVSEAYTAIQSGSSFTVATNVGIPTGTTGVDGRVTVFLTDPGDTFLYINNRRGGSVTLNITFL
jgi:hypothetical protein